MKKQSASPVKNITKSEKLIKRILISSIIAILAAIHPILNILNNVDRGVFGLFPSWIAEHMGDSLFGFYGILLKIIINRLLMLIEYPLRNQRLISYLYWSAAAGLLIYYETKGFLFGVPDPLDIPIPMLNVILMFICDLTMIKYYYNSTHKQSSSTSPVDSVFVNSAESISDKAIGRAFLAQQKVLDGLPTVPEFDRVLPGTIFNRLLGLSYLSSLHEKEIPAIDDSRRIRKLVHQPLPNAGQDLNKWMDRFVELPAQPLVRSILENGGRSEYSNAYGPGLKGVWWTKFNDYYGSFYFTPLDPKAYGEEQKEPPNSTSPVDYDRKQRTE